MCAAAPLVFRGAAAPCPQTGEKKKEITMPLVRCRMHQASPGGVRGHVRRGLSGESALPGGPHVPHFTGT